MMKAIALRSVPVLLLGALIYGGTGDLARAAKEVVDIPLSAWQTTGEIKEAGAGEGSDRYSGSGNIEFGALDGETGTGPFTCLVKITEGGEGSTEFAGTYELSKPGKPILTIDPATVQDDFIGTTVLSATLKAKPKSKQGVETMQLFLKIKVQVCDDNPTVDGGGDDKVKCKNGTIQYKGDGGPADVK